MFKPGDKLPSERDLAIQFGVSRLAIRSMSVLETLDLFRFARELSGGTIVTEPDFDHLDTFLIYL